MSEIRCLVCGGVHFRKGYYDIDLHIDIYSTAINDVNVRNRGINNNIDIDVDVNTSVYHDEIIPSGDLDFKLESDNKRDRFPDYVEVYKYACEDCGYLMSFTKEKDVESKNEEKERKKKERTYDWSDFGD